MPAFFCCSSNFFFFSAVFSYVLNCRSSIALIKFDTVEKAFDIDVPIILIAWPQFSMPSMPLDKLSNNSSHCDFVKPNISRSSPYFFPLSPDKLPEFKLAKIAFNSSILACIAVRSASVMPVTSADANVFSNSAIICV